MLNTYSLKSLEFIIYTWNIIIQFAIRDRLFLIETSYDKNNY